MASFLFMPHAPGGVLAHLTSCIAVAERLRERGHRPVFAYGGSRPELLDQAGLEWHPVPEVSGTMVADWFEDAEELLPLVDARLELIAEFGVDGCFASSGAGVETALAAAVPAVSLYHALHSTPQCRRRVAPWILRDDLRHPSRLAADARALLRSPRSRTQRARREINELRSRYRRPPEVHTALSTAPLLDPAAGIPSTWHYVGPISFVPAGSAGAPEPPGSGSRAYVSQGSTGSADLLERAVRELLEVGFAHVVASTGGLCEPGRIERLGSAVRAAHLHDSRAELRAADVAVIAGGHMTAMEALVAGVRTVVLPAITAHVPAARRVERLGTGRGLWPRAPEGTIGAAAAALVEDEAARERARRLAATLRAGWDGAENSASLAVDLVRSG